jgi:hypothetical protein
VILGVVVVILVIALNTEEARVRRALRRTPVSKVRDVAESTSARIVGRVAEFDPPIRGPLSGRTCVYYEAVVEEYRSSGKSGSWREIIKERRGVPFIVDDGTGRAIVDPTHVKLDLHADQKSKSGTLDDATPVEEEFLARHGKKSSGWVFNKKLRYSEAAIEIGEQVTVLGRSLREPDPDGVGAGAGGYREGPPTRLRLAGVPDAPVLISDQPSNL